MTVFYKGVAGRRNGKPLGAVIHNDAGGQGATAAFYKNWLPHHNAENGFAHVYVASDGIYRAEDYGNMAWHTANSTGNQWYVGWEVCQSMGKLEIFKENEQKTFKDVADWMTSNKMQPNVNTVRLHREFVATACPHRSYEIHGKMISLVKEYYISEIKKYMKKTTSTVTKPKTDDFNINNYITVKPSKIEVIKADYAYKEKTLKNKVGKKVEKGTVLTVSGIEYNGKYPRFKLKSGLYMTTRKDTVKALSEKVTTPAKKVPVSTVKKPAPVVLKGSNLPSKGTYKFTTNTNIRSGSSITSSVVGTYNKGESVAYDKKVTAGGYVWLSYIGGSGKRRYVAVV